MFQKLANTAIAAALVVANFSQVAKASDVTINKNGYAQCGDGGSRRASAGEMSTHFGNAFWSHLACAQWNEGFKILDGAPKADSSERLPTVEEFEQGDPLADCYYRSFEYGIGYHDVTKDEFDGTAIVNHGWYRLKAETFSQIQRAVLAACTLTS